MCVVAGLAGCGQVSREDDATGGRNNTSGGAPSAQGGVGGAIGGGSASGGSTTGGASQSGGGPSVDTCESDEGLGRLTELSVPNEEYDGPALVERSTKDELMLVYEVPPAGSTAVARRTRITVPHNDPGMAPIAPGTRLWLTRDRVVAVEHPGWTAIVDTAFTVRDGQGGTILFGAALATTSQDGATFPQLTASWPLTVLRPSHVATCARVDDCDWREKYLLEVLADQPETLPSVARNIRLGGIEYQAYGEHVAQDMDGVCASSTSSEWLSIDVRASDLDALTRDLPREALTACGRGNELEWPVFLGSLTLGVPALAFDGPVFYAGRSALGNGILKYEFADAPAGAMRGCYIHDWAGEVTAPAAGQEFWMTSEAGVTALREADRGRLLYLSTNLALPLEAAAAEVLARELGVGVETKLLCSYVEPDPVDDGIPDQPSLHRDPASRRLLWEVQLATEPFVVKSDTQTELVIDGQPYDVWVSSFDRLQLSVRAR